MATIPITIAKGDGIGPEIMDATLDILKGAGAPLEYHEVEIGEKVYLQGHPAGIKEETWDLIQNTKAFLKAPITTPQGGGFKSLNVTIRTALGLYANVRPCVAYNPFIKTKHPGMDVVIVRENEEDLYVGIEYQQTPEVVRALKLISRPGCERIIRYAFEYARAHNRKKVTCFTKDNILKLSDGLFHKVFDEIAPLYPDIENEHWIVDIGAAKLADTPENFDVIVMPNLYGDILSDVAAQIAGSVGLAGSANIGPKHSMFEAIHGSAPRRAGQNLANPSGLLLGAVMMLAQLGLSKEAELIHNGWLVTVEEGIHTYDIYKDGISKEKVGTKEFAKAVIKNLGRKPHTLKPVQYYEQKHQQSAALTSKPSANKQVVGIDVFLDSKETAQSIQAKLSRISTPLKLTLIANRGCRVWPENIGQAQTVDQWRCRYMHPEKKAVSHEEIAALLRGAAEQQLDFTAFESLCTFDGKPGYTLSQDEQ
jgi:isocitrate dehydrogenase